MNDRSDPEPRGPIRGRGFPNPEGSAPVPPIGSEDRPWRTMPPPQSGPEPADWPPHVSARPKWSPAHYTFTAIAVVGALISCVFLFTSLTGSVGTPGLSDDYSSYTQDGFSISARSDLSTGTRPGTPPMTAGADLEGASMSVLSTPSLATVYVEFDSVGVTPMTAPVPRAGSYLLTISKPGFATLDTVVTVRSGDHPLYRIKLRPNRLDLAVEPAPTALPAPAEAFGTLEILVQPWGTIYINGELHRSETDMLYSVQLPPGSHEVSVVHPRLGRSQRTVRVSPESKERLIFSLDG